MLARLALLAFLVPLWSSLVLAEPPPATLEPLVRVVDLSVGESQEVTLCDGKKAVVKLLEVKHTADPVREAVREARAHVEVNGTKLWLVSANYRLPVTIAGVQIDCPVTGAVYTNPSQDAWGLEKDARLRLWPARSPLLKPGTFGYPLRQRWFASSSQMSNEPVYVDGGQKKRADGKVYYHWGLDFGGCEGLTQVVAATDGLVVAAGKQALDGYDDTPVRPRYDVVYVLDARGWYYRYSHLHTIDAAITPGAKVQIGQPIGLLGKEGGSGGWTHLHFDISCRQPSGKWGTQEAYAFAWEAYLNEQQPKLIAVARPHQVVLAGDKLTLDGSRSWSAEGAIARYEWSFCDGGKAQGATVERTYDRPGCYSEVLKITDAAGRCDYDFAIVFVLDREKPQQTPPSVHVTSHPTRPVAPGEEVTFKARTFNTQSGEEQWDFGDGSPRQTTQSDGNRVPLAKDGYVELKHCYQRAGQYLVRVERTNEHGQKAVGYVRVEVVEKPRATAARAVAPAATSAAAPQPERPVVKLWPGTAPGEKGDIGPEQVQPPKDEPKPITRVTNVTQPTITLYKPAPDKDTGAAVVICPGGGYSILAMNHEGEDVAEWLNSIGVSGVLLKYRVPRRKDLPKHLPPLQDAQRAMSLVRSKAEAWKIDPKRIGILGFSAGGHLAAAATTNFDQRQYEAIDEADKLSCRPDFAVLVYPAYLLEGEQLAAEIRVTKETPPCFFIHAGDDRIGPENSIAMYLALKKAGVRGELHVYAAGGHGFGMHERGQPVNQWPQRCAAWLENQGWLTAKP